MTRRAATTPEGAVLAQCLALLRLYGIPHYRNNTGCATLPGRGGKPRLVRFGIPGAPDILGAIPARKRPPEPGAGRFLAIECKRPGGKLTDAQMNFLWTIADCGGVALVVDDPAELRIVLDRLAVDPMAVFPIRPGLKGGMTP